MAAFIVGMQFTGSPEAVRSRFLLLVARLFGERAAKRLVPSRERIFRLEHV
jgi:hypothetical protein